MAGYSIARPNVANDSYSESDVPGEFHSLADELSAEQIAITLIRVPPHSDFEQGTGHYHDKLEEIYVVGRGTVTMRFDDKIEELSAGSVVRVAPQSTRSHRNLGEEPVEIWAISRRIDESDATKVEDFWEASD